MDYREIAYEAADGIATITLDRPDRLNAFTNRMRDELIDAVDRVDADDDVRVAIVTGRGRGFCAGADLGDGVDIFARTGPAEFDPVRDADGGGMVTLRLYDAVKPFIAAINGPAVGVGITMTLPMDIRLVAEGAKLGFVFARRGLIPEACSSWFLPRVVGIGQAMEWVATGRVFGAQEALAAGLVRSVHAPDELLGAARALAREIAENTSSVSVAVSRQLLWRMLGEDHPRAAHALDSRGIFALARDRDAAEGVAAFMEKRPARFPLRVSQDLPDLWGGR
ncbi:enoyl-CoA hydratase-related protein [Solirubrobacter ginsenosidimutans]|uniref:Enoyl-CoA hydratase-related protein n=1 Tax=Solirubrobacter ginsenosidimutans TaxID=490573 RepID=A0A9X3RZL1_9ACTN|nr:enoyl-CoA hydratase-related protein [Solirubrobacter ginsenosidimutans]MDA0160319.1 enoyl-CoA hydratase-related protein [Solirubrobacter ginsenosidimutans]